MKTRWEHRTRMRSRSIIASLALALVACRADGTARKPTSPTARGTAAKQPSPVSTAQPETRWSGRREDSWGPGDDASSFLDRSMIVAAVDPMKPQVKACGAKTAATGTVQVRLKVSPDGRVASATVKSAPDPALGACVASAIAKAVFPRTDLGGTFTYPFTF